MEIRAVGTAEMIADERRTLADVLGGLSDREWSRASLCDHWTIRGVVGHLVMPLVRSTNDVLKAAFRYRSLEAAQAAIGRELGKRPIAELLSLLRQSPASARYAPPSIGSSAVLTDTIVHGQDICRPLGIERVVARDRLELVLEYLTGWRTMLTFVPQRRNTGLEYRAVDLRWSSGSGQLVEGLGTDLALAITGRSSAIESLTGDGCAVLSSRLIAERKAGSNPIS